jgi:hypothetical protein
LLMQRVARNSYGKGRLNTKIWRKEKKYGDTI